MQLKETFICEPLRTPVGKFGGVYQTLSAHQLGATVVKGLLEKTGLPAAAIDDVLFAQCYSTMDAPALGRVVAMDAGIPVEAGVTDGTAGGFLSSSYIKSVSWGIRR